MASIGDELSKLNPIDYRGRDDWLRLMMACHAAGIDREEFIGWSVSDPLYGNDWGEIERQWDALRPDGGVTGWAFRVEIRLADLIKGKCPRRSISPHGSETSQVPLTTDGYVIQQTGNLQRRVSSLLREVSKGDEPKLFWASCVMREIIAEGRINPSIAVR
jgi:hypothetical protein